MVFVFLVVAAGIAAQATLASPPLVACGGGAAALAAALVVRRPRVRRALILASLAALGVLRAGVADDPPVWLALRAPRITEVTGTVASYPSLGRDRIRFVVQPDHLPSRLLVTWSRPGAAAESVRYGDRVRLAGRTEREGTFAGFDYGRYLERQGIFATMRVEESSLKILGVRRGLLRAGDGIRQSLLGALQARLRPDEFALAQSYVFGDRFALSDETEEAFAQTGLMHILAVSGMHLTVLLAGIWCILRAFGLRAAVAYPLLAAFVLVAVWIIGPWVSFVRSALLFFFVAAGSVLADLGLVLRRSVRPMNALGAAAFVLVLIDPETLFDVGFQLSVAATAALLAFAPPRGWPPLRDAPPALARLVRPIVSLFLVSLAAQAGAAPVLALQFHKVQAWTAVTGMVAIPLASLALWLGVVALALSPIALIADVSARVFGWSLQAFAAVVTAAAHLPWTTLPADGRVGLWLAALAVFLHAGRRALDAPELLATPDVIEPRPRRTFSWRRAR